MNTPGLTDEVLGTPRRNALIPLVVGVVFMGIGLWAVPAMWSAGARIFPCIWGSFWFLFSGAAVVSGIHGVLKPPVYAVLTPSGIRLPKWRVEFLPWSHVLDARLAPKTQTDGEGTHHVFKEPLILRLRDAAPLRTGRAERWTRGMTATLPDGSVEWMIETQSCPLPANVFLARIQSRLLSEDVPVLPAKVDANSATFGGRPLNRPRSRVQSTLNVCGAWIAIIAGGAMLLAGAKTWKRGHDALHWERVPAISTSAEVVESGTEHTTWGVRIHYLFTHDGREYTGADLDLRYNDGSRAYVEARMGEYPPGRRFTVYYDPERPEDSAFYPPQKHDAYVWMGVGAAFLLFGLISRRFADPQT